MGIFEFIFLVIGLSFGSLATLISAGSLENISHKKALQIAVVFALCQAAMSALGWFAGHSLINFIGYYLLWFSFSIFFIIGLKMIFEAIKLSPEERRFDLMKSNVLILLAIASSIDAFITGISFGFLNLSILNVLIIVGITTFIFSLTGIYLGKSNRFVKPRAARFSGGLIMIFFAIKILLEHHY